MHILVVDDDTTSRLILEKTLLQFGHTVDLAVDGEEALRTFSPLTHVIISDWLMPRLDGLELCRKLRAKRLNVYPYFILLTGQEASVKNQHDATHAGIDDFLVKPFQPQALWTRLFVAERFLKFTQTIRQLETLLPICSYCKNVRDDNNYWQQIESYINERTGTDFSHSICPHCMDAIVKPQMDQLRRECKRID